MVCLEGRKMRVLDFVREKEVGYHCWGSREMVCRAGVKEGDWYLY